MPHPWLPPKPHFTLSEVARLAVSRGSVLAGSPAVVLQKLLLYQLVNQLEYQLAVDLKYLDKHWQKRQIADIDDRLANLEACHCQGSYSPFASSSSDAPDIRKGLETSRKQP